ncbi:hypothetical protein ACFXHA_04340 [Nocardia sp. NPDC059240]|uniref:hypothetical protein n=1 Tax=Nocardia sp. NPDC059240 TaxID=3346786 RepID=UPI0036BF124D
MSKTAALVGILAAASALGTASAGSAAAAPAPVAYNQCEEAQYVTDLFVDLFHGTFQGDRGQAAARAQAFAAAAPAEIKMDSLIEGYAETAVLDGVPSDLLLRTDPVFQAWGDVMDWHTSHCL